MNILFATSSIGLGHATRDLPLIKALLKEGHNVFSLSTGKSLELLKSEVPECSFIDSPDYPEFFTPTKMSVSRLLTKAPFIFKHMSSENKFTESFVKKNNINLVVTDGRYGVFSSKVPSYWISHQLRFISPARFMPAELGAQFMHTLVQKKFVNILVPDFEDDSLSGDLSHNLSFLNKDKITYLGNLSSIKKKKSKEDVDYFISLSSGTPSAAPFEKKIFSELHHLEGKVVVARGNPSLRGQNEIIKNAEVYGHLNRDEQADMMNRSKRIICRSGYTTLMELAELNKKAFFVPTPGQTEQIYLAEYHKQRKNFNFCDQKHLNLSSVPFMFDGYKGIERSCNTKDAVDKFMSLI